MNHFRFPLKVTGIAFLTALLIGIAGSTLIFNQKISDQRKLERTSLLGMGLGVGATLIIAPFWFAAAARVGSERRAGRDARKRESEDAS